jgi:hypothetical protein
MNSSSSRRGASGLPSKPPAADANDSEVVAINADITTISLRIDEMNCVVPSSSGSSSSSFVANLRSSTEENKFSIVNNPQEKKLAALLKLLERVHEHDRLVLKKTAPPVSATPQRRKSRGSDLASLPTHLHITDRLLDLHAQAQRVTVITNTAPSPRIAPSPSTESNPEDKQKIETLSLELARASKQLEEALDSGRKRDEELNSAKNANTALQAKLSFSEKSLISAVSRLVSVVGVGWKEHLHANVNRKGCIVLL